VRDGPVGQIAEELVAVEREGGDVDERLDVGSPLAACVMTAPPYLVAKHDNAIAPDLQRFMARRIHAHTRQINGSHALYISHPKAVARLAEQAARATR
jgi:hypothetical protein